MRRSSQFALSISMLAGLQSEFAVPAVAVDSSPSFKSAIESCKEQLSLPLSEKLERLLEKAFDAARTGKNDPSSDRSIIDQGPLSGTETNNFNAYLSCSMVYPLKVRQPQPEPNEHEMFVAASRPADFLNNSGQQISKACEHGDYKNGDQSLAILCLGKEVLKGSGIQVKAAITDFHKIGCQNQEA